MMFVLALLLSTASQDFSLPPGQYRATIALNLSAKGKVKGCSIAQSSGFADADKVACKNAKAGQYEPLVDATGKAIEGTIQQTVRWKVAESEY